MNKIKKGLGRGLSSLIGETKVEIATNKLLISDLYPNKFQPRKIFDEESLNDLENSQRSSMQKKTKSLFGIPLAVKDLIDVEGLPTTYGVPKYKNNVAKKKQYYC